MLPIIRGWTDVRRTPQSNLRLGAVLAFVAGATNAGGFLAVGQYTSHMTGIVSAMADNLVWEAHRDRLKIGSEPVAVYRLETHMLGYSIVIYASTLGEILRVELPDDLTATLDEWTKS